MTGWDAVLILAAAGALAILTITALALVFDAGATKGWWPDS